MTGLYLLCTLSNTECLNSALIIVISVCKQHLYIFHPDFLDKEGAERRHPKSDTTCPSLSPPHSCGNLAGGEARCPLLWLGGRKSRGPGHSNALPDVSIMSGQKLAPLVQGLSLCRARSR